MPTSINIRRNKTGHLEGMTKLQREKAELLRFVDIQSFANPTAVTLTMKMRVEGKSNDMETASTNFRHFMNRLNHTLLKSAAKRHGKRLKVFCVRESNPDGRLHYHALIDRPVRVGFEEFTSTIRYLWGRTDFGYRQIDVQDNADAGWLIYLLKIGRRTACSIL